MNHLNSLSNKLSLKHINSRDVLHYKNIYKNIFTSDLGSPLQLSIVDFSIRAVNYNVN